MKIKKILCLIMAAQLLFCLAACKETPLNTSSLTETTNNDKNNEQNYITLLYSAADTFNPYTATTQINRQLCNLLYEPLVKLDNEFEPVYSIAKSVKTEDAVCTVVIGDYKFSDGSAVTADDIVYSYNLAKNSATSYSAALYEVSSVTAVNSKTVAFSLSKADPYFQNVLDFPIIKTGSAAVTDSDSVAQPPIGCGRYKVAQDRQKLVINNLYFGAKGSISEICLINAPDSESVSHYIEIGAADMYYSDISDGTILRMSGNKLDVNLNNLVYIGVNQSYGALAQNSLRQAISSAIDRNKICQNSYYNNALPATGFFTPVWKEVKSVQNIQIHTNSQITVENLEKIGYNELDKEGVRITSSGKGLRFSLLVNSENQAKVAAARLIASQLSEFGIKITVVEKSYENYIQSLASGNFQLFLGEIKLSNNMDFSCMVLEGGSAAYGLATSQSETDGDSAEAEPVPVSKSASAINGFYSGKNTIADVATVLQTEMPFIPVCYRTGILLCNENIENINKSSASDIYFSIESYFYNN